MNITDKKPLVIILGKGGKMISDVDTDIGYSGISIANLINSVDIGEEIVHETEKFTDDFDTELIIYSDSVKSLEILRDAVTRAIETLESK